jgi:hypothetical protein
MNKKVPADVLDAVARAAAWDAGNRSARERGLPRWDRAAYNAACAEFNRLCPRPTTQTAEKGGRP